MCLRICVYVHAHVCVRMYIYMFFSTCFCVFHSSISLISILKSNISEILSALLSVIWKHIRIIRAYVISIIFICIVSQNCRTSLRCYFCWIISNSFAMMKQTHDQRRHSPDHPAFIQVLHGMSDRIIHGMCLIYLQTFSLFFTCSSYQTAVMLEHSMAFIHSDCYNETLSNGDVNKPTTLSVFGGGTKNNPRAQIHAYTHVKTHVHATGFF